METIAVLNLKGGVGKSSLCHHLSGAFSKMGRPLLLVDNDPGQSSLTRGFLGKDATRDLPWEETVAALYAGKAVDPEMLVRPTGVPGVDLVAGSKEARRFNTPVPEECEAERFDVLKEFLAEVASLGRHEICLIDCKPDLELFSFAALVAADWLVVPSQPEDYGVQAHEDVAESMGVVTAGGFNPGLRLLGYIYTKVQRLGIHQVHEEIGRGQHGSIVFEHRMPELKTFKEALTYHKPAGLYQPKSAAAKIMVSIATEMLDRIAAARSGPMAAGTTDNREVA